jgi:hypothetical protein
MKIFIQRLAQVFIWVFGLLACFSVVLVIIGGFYKGIWYGVGTVVFFGMIAIIAIGGELT